MSLQHARKPSLLSDSDYGEQTDIIEKFLADDRSLPNRPTHLVAGQAAKGLAFRQALDAMNTALGYRKEASDTIKDTVAAMDELLRWMRNILPTLSDESILLPFGLDTKIPDGYAELKDRADMVDAHWQTVKLEPLFAPVAVRVNELAPLISTYETAREAQIVLTGEYEQRQNEKDIARAAHHEIERLIFNWYASYYPDGQHIYWENTPWGKAPLKPGEVPEPGIERAKYPDEVDDLAVELNFLELPEITYKYTEEVGVTFNLYKADVKIGDPAPERPAAPWLSGVEGYSVTDSSAVNNRDNYYWVVAVFEGVEGDFAEPVFVKYKPVP